MNLKKRVQSGILATFSLLGLLAVVTPVQKANAQGQQVEPGTMVIQNVIDLNRAKNLARQAAEKENGGLGMYRAEPIMHGPATLTNHVENENSWTFTFYGSPPPYTTPMIESVVTVSKDGERVTIEYNGSVRTPQ
jgi:hypothetical protein